MTYQQLVVPDPFIPCTPGWCLQYVRQAFRAPAVEPTATAGWDNAQFKHEDRDFPSGCWVPVWFSLETEPAGHVALLSPDGSVYSTTNPNQYTARHHPSLDDLIAVYAPNNPLTYLGWTEDISGVRVVENVTINVEGMVEELSAQDVEDLKSWLAGDFMTELDKRDEARQDETRKQLADSRTVLMSAIETMNPDDIVKLVPDALVDAVAKGLAARLSQ